MTDADVLPPARPATWADVQRAFPTWGDVVRAEASWADLVLAMAQATGEAVGPRALTTATFR